VPQVEAEQTIQFKVSAPLKKQIRRRALERDETVRTFILRALREQGVVIAEAELSDRRKSGSK
jgi:hypothetical protein